MQCIVEILDSPRPSPQRMISDLVVSFEDDNGTTRGKLFRTIHQHDKNSTDSFVKWIDTMHRGIHDSWIIGSLYPWGCGTNDQGLLCLDFSQLGLTARLINPHSREKQWLSTDPDFMREVWNDLIHNKFETLKARSTVYEYKK
jgi:hypothetical protein